MRSLCSIDGCDRPMSSRGWCSAHWQRWQRLGDPLPDQPLRSVPKRGEARAYFERACLAETDQCIPWPYNQDERGRGQLNLDGQPRRVAALVCERVHGPRPPGMVVCHAPVICHDPNCINPRHLRWDTQSANMLDMHLDGTFPDRTVPHRRA